MTAEFENRLAALRQRFLARAAEDLAGLTAVPPDQADPEAIGFLAHRLAGAAATFGFPAVSEAAAALDAACRQTGAIDGPAHQALVAQLQALPLPPLAP